MDTTLTDPLLGRLLDDRYQVEERIARGGMATVYRAVDTRLDRTVALKVMNPVYAEDPDFVARFTREARAAARLSDSHVVSVFDQGEDGGVVFLVMEYVPGRTLRDVVHERGRLGPAEALELIDPVLRALTAAHRAGLVHRDVKPENVLITADGKVKVVDFGLARAATSSDPNATRGLLIGTVAYLAPEQVEHGTADARSDVYASGVLLFEMLTGAPPFTGETPLAVAYQHVNAEVPAPSTQVPGMPGEVDALVVAATRRDPEARPVNAAAFLAEVQRVRATLPATTDAPTDVVDLRDTVVVPRPGAAPGPAVAGDPGDPDDPEQPTPTAPALKRRRGRGWIALLLVVLLAAGAAGAAWWLGSGRFTAVPGVVGLSQQQAEGKLAEVGLDVAYADAEYSEIVPKDSVISSDPDPGDRILGGGTVTLTLSLGPERFDVPRVVGRALADARERIEARNLTVGSINREFSESVAQGAVISSSPEAGSSVRADTAVSLVVSRGLPPVDVPTVVGARYDAAQRTLEGVGLKIRQVGEEYSQKVAEGAIISQSPSAGAKVSRGSTVDVVVSKGPPLVKVPSVVDAPLDDAIARLEAAGFKVEVYEPFGISPLNRVASQDPRGGSMAPKGSTVRVGII